MSLPTRCADTLTTPTPPTARRGSVRPSSPLYRAKSAGGGGENLRALDQVAGRFFGRDDIENILRQSNGRGGVHILRRSRRHIIQYAGQIRNAFCNGPEMLIKPLLRRPIVRRNDQQRRVHANLRRFLRERDAGSRVVPARPRNYRAAPADRFFYQPEHLPFFVMR